MEENKGLKEWLETTANEHRCNPTCSEKNVIKYLDKHKIKYEFQKPILCDDRGYIVDFCFEGNLVLEVDGDTHNSEEAKENDYIRTQMLNENGYEVIRIRNEQTKKGVIEETMKTVVDKIRNNKITEIIRQKEADEWIKKSNKALDSSLNLPVRDFMMLMSLDDNDKARMLDAIFNYSLYDNDLVYDDSWGRNNFNNFDAATMAWGIIQLDIDKSLNRGRYESKKNNTYEETPF